MISVEAVRDEITALAKYPYSVAFRRGFLYGVAVGAVAGITLWRLFA